MYAVPHSAHRDEKRIVPAHLGQLCNHICSTTLFPRLSLLFPLWWHTTSTMLPLMTVLNMQWLYCMIILVPAIAARSGAVLEQDVAKFTLFPRLPTGTCDASTPCVNAACCGTNNGLCGYSPTECGSGNCTSNCDAKAQCGQYAASATANCPLDVCCSEFGYVAKRVSGQCHILRPFQILRKH